MPVGLNVLNSGGIMKHFSLTDTGKVRKKNEDFLYTNHDRGLFIIADGMGGHNAGEIASRKAVEIFVSDLPNVQTVSESELVDSLMHANKQVYRLAQEYPEYKGMGTTFTAARIRGNTVTIVHVGDSRAYRYSKGKIEQLTIDHTLPYELYRIGKISEEEYLNHPESHMLFKAVGTQEYILPDHLQEEFLNGDFLLICSDGLSNKVDASEIATMIDEYNEPEMVVKKLIELANQRGGQDNISVICVKFEECKELKYDR